MPLATDKVEQFLGLMLDENGKPLSKEFRDHVFAVQQERRKNGDPVLIGDLAIELSHKLDKEDKWPRVTEHNKKDALRTQAVLFATAAEVDIDAITSKKAPGAKVHEEKEGDKKSSVQSKPFWNTNLIGEKADTSVEAGAVNAGHLARSMIILSHDKPELAAALKPAILNAAELAKTLADPKKLNDPDKGLDKKKFEELRDSAIAGVVKAAKEGKAELPKNMTIDEYAEQMRKSLDKSYLDGKAQGAVKGMGTRVQGGEEYETAAATVPGRQGQIKR